MTVSCPWRFADTLNNDTRSMADHVTLSESTALSAPTTLKSWLTEDVVRPVDADVVDLVLAVAQLTTVDDTARVRRPAAASAPSSATDPWRSSPALLVVRGTAPMVFDALCDRA